VYLWAEQQENWGFDSWQGRDFALYHNSQTGSEYVTTGASVHSVNGDGT